MNLLCGVMGVIYSFGGRFDIAFYLMLAAAVFDFCDGFAARALNAYSDVGKELDSLADVISFGLLPSIMLYRLGFEMNGPSVWVYIPLVIVVFSALRLAKFNTDERQKDNFIGLATPACAILCGGIAHYIYLTPGSFLETWAQSNIFFPVLSLLLSTLLVSELDMFSLKFKKGQLKGSMIYRLRFGFFALCVAACLLVFLLHIQFSMIFILAILIYIIMNVINDLAVAANRK